jgi:hypothetical protein
MSAQISDLKSVECSPRGSDVQVGGEGAAVAEHGDARDGKEDKEEEVGLIRELSEKLVEVEKVNHDLKDQNDELNMMLQEARTKAKLHGR